MEENLKVIQQKLVFVLSEFDQFCAINHLTYYMLGGTLLGAVRHKGFIPWDDDVDICMPRKDYMRFVKAAAQELPGNLYLDSIYNNPDYRYCSARLSTPDVKVINRSAQKEKHEGIWIDIIPLDGLPNQKVKRFIHKIKLWLYKRRCQLAQFDYAVDIKRKRNILETIIIRILMKLAPWIKLDYRLCLKHFDRLLQKYNYDDSDYVINYVACIGFRELFTRESFGKGRKYSFEGQDFIGPSDADAVLKHIYGNYMELPPESERQTHNLEIIRVEEEPPVPPAQPVGRT